ncbi:MAG: amino acid ABC transporter permease [Clostridiales bacterium]|nr:amino acid ABC transporter permease [Clostridiales bacterium]
MKLVNILLQGSLNTGRIFALTLLLSLPLGVLVAVGRMSRHRLLSRPVALYIYVMRGTPLMLQVMFIYFLLPQVLPFRFDRFWAAIFAFVINYAAYFAEIFRGGIQSIPDGQREAGQVLGLTRTQVFVRILLPQAVKRSLLPITNEVITLVKDTALASTVAVAELMEMARKQVSSSSSVEPYLVAAIMYLIFNGVAEKICRAVERRFDYYR